MGGDRDGNPNVTAKVVFFVYYSRSQLISHTKFMLITFPWRTGELILLKPCDFLDISHLNVVIIIFQVTKEVSLLSRWMAIDLYIREVDSLRFELSTNRCSDRFSRLAEDILEKGMLLSVSMEFVYFSIHNNFFTIQPYKLMFSPLREFWKRFWQRTIKFLKPAKIILANTASR